MSECWRCKETIDTEQVNCPNCNAELSPVEPEKESTNWLKNFKYVNFFASLFWPTFVAVVILGVINQSSADKYLYYLEFMFLVSFFGFCCANYYEKIGKADLKLFSTERRENLIINFTLIVSLLFLIAGIIELI